MGGLGRNSIPEPRKESFRRSVDGAVPLPELEWRCWLVTFKLRPRPARKNAIGGLFAGGKEMDRKRVLAAKERLVRGREAGGEDGVECVDRSSCARFPAS